MPPRLAHKKSRKGCQRCKARKVKCSEERPACAACSRHNLPCQYPDEGALLKPPSSRNGPYHSDSTLDQASPSSLRGPVTPYSLENDVEALNSDQHHRRLLELRLLHHYVTVAIYTIPACKGNQAETSSIYNVDAVKMAFQFPFLLNTIFAFAALHMAQTGQDLAPKIIAPNATMPNGDKPVLADGLEYARAHRIYLNLAIRQQREIIADLSPTNADAICVNSVLLSIIALKLLPDSGGPAYEPPVQWISMTHAVSTLVQAAGPLLTPDTAMRRIISTTDPDFRDKAAMFNFEHAEPFIAILTYPGETPSDEDTDITYSLAVAYVGGVYRAIMNRDPQRQIARRITSTAPMLPKQFVTLVEQKRPRALVIIAHLMSMAKYVENYWFFAGAAEREVYGIQSILPEDWQWAMKWPLEMLRTLVPPPVTERDE